jgi:hypothetical protein
VTQPSAGTGKRELRWHVLMNRQTDRQTDFEQNVRAKKCLFSFFSFIPQIIASKEGNATCFFFFFLPALEYRHGMDFGNVLPPYLSGHVNHRAVDDIEMPKRRKVQFAHYAGASLMRLTRTLLHK